MVTPAKPHGYNYRQHVSKIRAANRIVRENVRRILEERPGPALSALYLAQIGISLGDIDEALNALTGICYE